MLAVYLMFPFQNLHFTMALTTYLTAKAQNSEITLTSWESRLISSSQMFPESNP